MTKGGVTTDALDAEPLPPISPPQHSDPHSSNNGNGAHNINGADMDNAIKPANSSQDEEDDSKSTTSEQDNERVREKLKKTSIANVRSDSSLAGEHGEKDDALSNAVSEADQDMSDGKEDDTRRRRKRSFDETEGDGDGDGGGKDQRPRHRVHERKRSREISDEDMAKAAKALNRVKTPPTHPEEDEIMSQGEEEASASITSPRKLERKRGRGRLDEDEKDKEVDPKKKISRKEEEWNRVVEKSIPPTNRGITSVNVSTSGMANGGDLVTVEAATVKSSEGELPTNSGFANTSAKSPFATAGSGAKPLFGPGTSASDLFKNSKFGAASSSTTSPFASASPFASTSSFSPSPFGSINAQSSGSASPFGAGGLHCGSKAKPSGFGMGFSSGYGPSGFAALASKSGDVISSAPKLTKPPGGISAKPFGAPDEDDKGTSDEDDEGSDGDAEEKKEEPTTDEKAEIFTEQEVVTGEENEMTIFKTLGKIFFFDKENKQWKERGRGTLKLNRTIPSSGDDDDDDEAGAGENFKDSARLIMRTEGTYLVVLNVPIYKGMKIGGDSSGSVPTSNQLYFMTLENGTPIQMIIKCKSTTIAKELHKHVSDLQEELFT